MKKVKISDIFYSIQGEGIYAGRNQLFVRFYECHWNCRFCDTRLNAYEKYNPLELYQEIKRFTLPYHALCLTGGEPLLQKDFLKHFLRFVKYDGITVYLETNGILDKALKEVIKDIDIIAMDMKLPSSTGMDEFWAQHQRFLKIAAQKEVFVKVVICQQTEYRDLDKVVKIIGKFSKKRIPLILQPNFYELGKELLAKTSSFQKHCAHKLDCVQVIPQLHKITGVK